MAEQTFEEKYPERVEMAEKISKALRDAYDKSVIEIDHGDHCDSSIFDEHDLERLFDPNNFWIFTVEMGQEFLGGIGKERPKTGNHYDDWTTLGRGMSYTCYKCGEHLSWDFNGKTIKAFVFKSEGRHLKYDPSPCVFAKGMPEITAEIDIPSGYVLVANDLRHIFTEDMIWPSKDERWGQKYSVNHFAGKMRFVERYAKHGMLTAYMTGSADVYHNGSDSLVIKTVRENQKRPKGHQKIGYIILDLWWFGLADYQRCLELDQKQVEKTLVKDKKSFMVGGHDVAKIPMTPGRYKMVHQETDEGYRVSITKI